MFNKKLRIFLFPCSFVDLTLIQRLFVDYSLFKGKFYKFACIVSSALINDEVVSFYLCKVLKSKVAYAHVWLKIVIMFICVLALGKKYLFVTIVCNYK